MKKSAIPTWIKPLILLLGVAALAVGVRVLSHGRLSDFAADRSPLGITLFIVLAAAACAFSLPRMLVASAASAAYGLWSGVAVAMLAQLLGCALDFYWARFIGHDWAQRRISGRLAKLNSFLSAHPFSTTLMLRLFPLGSNFALNLLAGVSTIAALPFLAGSALGYVPQTLVFALVGTGRSVSLWLGGALFVVSTALGLWLAKRHKELNADQGD